MKIVDLLGGQAEYYLNHTCKTIDKQLIHIIFLIRLLLCASAFFTF